MQGVGWVGVEGKELGLGLGPEAWQAGGRWKCSLVLTMRLIPGFEHRAVLGSDTSPHAELRHAYLSRR